VQWGTYAHGGQVGAEPESKKGLHRRWMSSAMTEE
jgi:hypothetical protein